MQRMSKKLLTRAGRTFALDTLVLAWSLSGVAGVALAQTASQPPPGPPSTVTFYGDPKAVISGGVMIPAGAAIFMTSGTVPPVADQNAKPDDRARYGADTKTQAIGVLKAIEKQLTDHGLSMKDVIFIRAFLVADPAKGNKLDLEGWNDAYKQFFGTAENPTKTARSTIGVAQLVNPAFLLEVEAVAVYPAKPATPSSR